MELIRRKLMEKKEYIAPKLEIVEINHHAPLLDGSCTDGDCEWNGGFGLIQDSTGMPKA